MTTFLALLTAAICTVLYIVLKVPSANIAGFCVLLWIVLAVALEWWKWVNREDR